ncbi:OLC1v1021994C1 [Oldenlandia corymbosa var. corymbosa]|uniref:OLC1v1021994C1 n=1 Tax=Oldenlandia corymbosa var. corymbosa TaxID=529605 RepID=A0AAV1BZH0_OLDCO|nr:OLC1v1021994C1 [Oldenlandia corymbosa var. corymbosa]
MTGQEMKSFTSSVTETKGIMETSIESVQRRKANYKPNIWNYDLLLQSLTSVYSDEVYRRKAQKLKQELTWMFTEVNDKWSMLYLVDTITKIGLASYFQQEIKQYLSSLTRTPQNVNSRRDGGVDLYSTALCFRLLRQFGFEASQEMFRGFVNKNGDFKPSLSFNVQGVKELYEASNLGCEWEDITNEARLFCINTHSTDNILALHWTAEWYNLKKHILAYEKEGTTNSKLLELARLHFNIVQATHQEDLKEIIRWWIELGIIEKLSFSRDRIIESFLYAAGVAYEPQHGSLRKWLTKVIKLVLLIDDVYDIYGSLEHLECFTNAVDRWRYEEVRDLPECMQVCFSTLYNTTADIAVEIQKEKGWNSVLPHFQIAWGEFCKSLLLEAKWDNTGYTPSLEEYLENAFISSSGPLVSLLIILGVQNPALRTISEILKDNKDLIYHTSLIIRLCNDQGTFTEELNRGDAPSSIICHMRESNVSEESAKEHIKSIISQTWEKINGYCVVGDEPIKHYLTNAARVAHFIYQHGDGFGVQDRKRVLSNLIDPLPLYN